jgi:hypothetical protein
MIMGAKKNPSAGGVFSAPTWKPLMKMFDYVHNNIVSLNQSKIFAGLIIIVLNISSKFVTIRLSKTMESYLKYTFSRDILVFAMAWMGTRDIYIALLIALLFSFSADYLLNEESRLCCLPASFTNYHIEKFETADVSPEEIEKAKKLLERVGELPDSSKTDATAKTPTPATTGSSSSNTTMPLLPK